MSSGTDSQEEVARTGLRGGPRQKEPVGEIRSWVRLKSWPVGPNQTREALSGPSERGCHQKQGHEN